LTATKAETGENPTMTRNDAFDVLHYIRAKVNQDFFSLTRAQVATLLERADAFKYRKPKDANGSRARYFYAYVSRVARKQK
jgi:hypothetical protein